MSRYWYGVLAVALLVVAGLLFAYRKETVSPAYEHTTADFGGVSLNIEYATTTASRELGLGGRANIPSDYGMLFVFPKDDRPVRLLDEGYARPARHVLA